jgi:hypothetical protein
MRNGIVGVIGSEAMARCAPTKRPAKDKETVVMRTAINAINEYPPLRAVVVVAASGIGMSFDRAKKISRMKDENDVNDPQKPVANPIYNGIVFLVAICAFLATARSTAGCPGLDFPLSSSL